VKNLVVDSKHDVESLIVSLGKEEDFLSRAGWIAYFSEDEYNNSKKR
jgi:hypothetical protein